MAVCEACGTDNRDQARFCTGCVRPMPAAATVKAAPVEAPKPSGPVQVCATCQTANPLAATVCKSCRASLVPDWVAPPAPVFNPGASSGAGKAIVLAGFAALLGVGVWWSLRDGNPPGPSGFPATQVAAIAVAALPEAAPVVAAPSQEITRTATQTAAASSPLPVAAEREPPASEARRQAVLADKRRQAAKEARERLALAREKQRTDLAAQQKPAQEAAARDDLAKASAPAAVPQVPAVKTVEQACASSSNFFSREVCRLQSCRLEVFASDPVCVQFRQMEAANRSEPTN